MTFELFSDDWAAEWCRQLGSSSAYRVAAANWEGGVVLTLPEEEDEPRRAVYLDAAHGSCRKAFAAGASDIERASYVFQAPLHTWRQLFSGELAPAMALFTGKLRLTRGNMQSLLPFAGAARELIATAGAVPSHDPSPA